MEGGTALTGHIKQSISGFCHEDEKRRLYSSFSSSKALYSSRDLDLLPLPPPKEKDSSFSSESFMAIPKIKEKIDLNFLGSFANVYIGNMLERVDVCN